MAQHSQVPKFGSWESGDGVPYTAYFERARSKRSAKMNLINPQEKLDKLSNNVSPIQAPPLQMETKSSAQNAQEAVRIKHVCNTSQEDVNQRRPAESPLHVDNINRKVATKTPVLRDSSTGSNDSPKKAIPMGIGSYDRVEHSTSNPHHQPRIGGKGSGVSSRSWQRNGSTHGSNNLSPSTPGRSRLRPVTQSNGTPDDSAAVPKFGDWDVTNPASADGFTHAFNKVREEKLNATGKAPVAATQNSHSKGQKQHDNEISKSCCCFPWSK